jgi:hypothetical protein
MFNFVHSFSIEIVVVAGNPVLLKLVDLIDDRGLLKEEVFAKGEGD